MSIESPPVADVDRRPTSLAPGELLVWEVLRNQHPEAGSVREPYVSGKRPDFAVMRHACGMVLIEVKDSPFLDSTSEVISEHVARSVTQVDRVRARLKAVIPAYSGLSDYVELKTVVVYPFLDGAVGLTALVVFGLNRGR